MAQPYAPFAVPRDLSLFLSYDCYYYSLYYSNLYCIIPPVVVAVVDLLQRLKPLLGRLSRPFLLCLSPLSTPPTTQLSLPPTIIATPW
jgi:hypothetical protein